jgi:WD40-like Beta Propeller Repeat
MSWKDQAPGEREAGERSWEVVRAAWESRTPHPHARRRRGPVVAIAVALAVVAAVLSPPGMAVLGSLRDAVRGEKNAAPALFSLPTQGRLLVESQRGVWVVEHDGSKRLLSGYRDPAWSPHGLYLAAIKGHELRALEPNGRVHWSIARPGTLVDPSWSFEGYRIAYLAGRTLRVVNGDKTGDHLFARRVARVAPVWRNGSHVLAYVDAAHDIHVVDVDTRRVIGTWHVGNATQLAWSAEGTLLAVVEGAVIAIYRAGGRQLAAVSTHTLGGPGGGNPVVSAAFSPRGRMLAFAAYDPVDSTTRIEADDLPSGAMRRIFSGAGRIGDVSWSPDGRWLVMNWQSADQLLFIRSTAVRGIKAVSNVRAEFGRGTGAFGGPSLAGWCCP